MKFYLQVLKKYAVVSGRASRQEYWMFALFTLIISIVLNVIDKLVGSTYTYYLSSGVPVVQGYISGLYNLALFIPSIAVQVRRLHDVNKSGHLLWLFFVPILAMVGALLAGAIALMILLVLVILGIAIWMLVLYCKKGTDGPNKYGEDPEGGGGFKFSFEEGGDVKEE